MSATLQSQAVAYANGVMSIVQSLSALDSQFKVLNNQNSQLLLGNVLSAFATCAVSGDGSLAASADTVPNSGIGHVMDPRALGQTGLTRAISAYSIGAALTILQQMDALLSAGVPTQQTAAPNIVAQMVGG